MAFAGAHSSLLTSAFITEKDVIRQVASNITKESLIVQKPSKQSSNEDDKSVADSKLNGKNLPEAKRLMLENIQKVQKVWYAFVKLIKN